MKRALISFVSVVMAITVLAGCGVKWSGSDEAAAPAVSGEPKVIQMTWCLYYSDATDFPDLKEQFPVEFEKLTGYKLDINVLPREDYLTKLNLLAVSGSLRGLIRGFSNDDIMRFKSDGVIDSMDSVLNNPVYKTFPVDMQEKCIYDGHLWGVPNGYDPSMFTRHYRKDWLDNLGLEVPRTIDEFYDVMRAFTFDDPNQSGEDDTVGFTSRNTWIIQDIFQAFDARLDDQGDYPIHYDALLGYFTDKMPSANMVECLTFLNKCYSEGIMDPESFTNTGAAMRDMINNGIAGSAFYWVSQWESVGANKNVRDRDPWAAPEGDLFVQTPGLVGKRTTHVNTCGGGSGAPVMLAAGTPNGEEMINWYVDAFFGSEQGNLWGRYGIEGTNWRKDASGTVIRLKDANESVPSADICGINPLYNFLKIPYVVEGTPDEMRESLEDTRKKYQFIEDASKDPMTYAPTFQTVVSDTWDRLVADIEMAYKDCYATAITGSVPVQQAVDTYTTIMRSIGAAKAIDECNAFYGLEAPPFEY